MSKLSKAPAVKGQKSLFSFFTKKPSEDSTESKGRNSTKTQDGPADDNSTDNMDHQKKVFVESPLNKTEDDTFDLAPGTAISSDDEWSSGSNSGSCSQSDDDYLDERAQPPKKRARLQKVSLLRGQNIATPTLKNGTPSLPPKPKRDVILHHQTSSTPVSKSMCSSPSVISTPSTPLTMTPSSGAKSVGHPQLSASKERDEMPLVGGVGGFGSHEHHGWDFLINRRDKNGHSPDHPGFDKRTIFIPESVLKQQTPAMRQWFQLKADYFDTILFFKVGKFYELFHMDADVGVTEADLIYMKGTKAHCGFPEVSYGKYASALVAKGYRVARVEQTETPEMMKERNKASKKGATSKVVARELCSILTKGTRTYCHLDDLSILECTEPGQSSSLLMCIAERDLQSGDGAGVVEYGVCFVDTALSAVSLAQFEDDKLRYRLRTLLSRHRPTEVLLEKGATQETRGVVRLLAPDACVDDYWNSKAYSPDSIMDMLRKKYFTSLATMPPVLNAAYAGAGEGSSDLMITALGVVTDYLKRGLIDTEIMSFGNFLAYVPPDNDRVQPCEIEKISTEGITSCSDFQFFDSDAASGPACPGRHMILDSVTLENLEILSNSFDHSERGSLWGYMNRCKTDFGKRLLRGWICRPLFQVEDITCRSAAVAELMDHSSELVERARITLKSCPDLERLLGRIHSNSLKKKEFDHPDSRAVMYENGSYNSRKIKCFTDILRGFDSLVATFELFAEGTYSSKMLQTLFGPRQSGLFPLDEIKTLLAHFREVFDEKQAKRDGFIRPLPGVDAEYDEARAAVADIERSFDAYLLEQKRETGIRELTYFGTNKDRYQLEVPMSQTHKVPKQWTSKSQKKTHRRFWSPHIEETLARLSEAEDRLAYCQQDTMRRVFEKFDEKRSVWSAAIRCGGVLDALLALVSVSNDPGYCWATFRSGSDTSITSSPLLIIDGGRHPMLEKNLQDRGSGSFIANDVSFGNPDTCSTVQSEYHPRMLLVSGPNMGGKSTLLRQTCLIAIMAQLGCKVPAHSCVMTPVDRIFTRIGASDKILMGQSTFFVELAETALILNNATEHSLCILDELGRGTSTFDGSAIAHAVVENIVSRVQCRTLFATHYHNLINEWSCDPRIKLGHMDCLVQCDRNDKLDSIDDDVTFLYKLRDGSSPKSYGINVAKLARLPCRVLENAFLQSRIFEDNMRNGTALKMKSKSHFSHFFDRVISAVSSDMTVDDAECVIRELWHRYVHFAKRV